MTTETRTTLTLLRDTVSILRRMAADRADREGGHINISQIVQEMLDDALSTAEQKKKVAR
ncbi:hypothetical protein ACFOD4_04515 [Pseudoroseomonas globiformis]|uniref:Uncharacterized protein n=1 Tax=Teichococcus globiformis TaxID=2307229 RepID=A0ABV7FZS6_9PROT